MNAFTSGEQYIFAGSISQSNDRPAQPDFAVVDRDRSMPPSPAASPHEPKMP
jgi:hypothetical protein